MRIRPSVIVVACAAWLVSPHTADAQWYVAGYLGANHTTPATVTIDQPAVGTSLEFRDVKFAARPSESPQYYGVRAGYMFGERRRWGAEFELVHPKLFAETSR